MLSTLRLEDRADYFKSQYRTEDERIVALARFAISLRNITKRWKTELRALREKDKEAQEKDVGLLGKDKETQCLFDEKYDKLQTEGLLPYAEGVTRRRSEDVSPEEFAACEKLIEAYKEMNDWFQAIQFLCDSNKEFSGLDSRRMRGMFASENIPL